MTHYRMQRRIRQPVRIYGAPLADLARKSPSHVKGAATKRAKWAALRDARTDALQAELRAADPFAAFIEGFV